MRQRGGEDFAVQWQSDQVPTLRNSLRSFDSGNRVQLPEDTEGRFDDKGP